MRAKEEAEKKQKEEYERKGKEAAERDQRWNEDSGEANSQIALAVPSINAAVHAAMPLIPMDSEMKAQFMALMMVIVAAYAPALTDRQSWAISGRNGLWKAEIGAAIFSLFWYILLPALSEQFFGQQS